MNITINIGDREEDILKRRSKRNFLTVKEQIEDIIRRSCIRDIKNTKPKDPCDDRLVSIFSKQNKGRRTKQNPKEKEIAKLLETGKQHLKKDKQEARKTYVKIRSEYNKLKNKNKNLYNQIMNFYKELVV